MRNARSWYSRASSARRTPNRKPIAWRRSCTRRCRSGITAAASTPASGRRSSSREQRPGGGPWRRISAWAVGSCACPSFLNTCRQLQTRRLPGPCAITYRLLTCVRTLGPAPQADLPGGQSQMAKEERRGWKIEEYTAPNGEKPVLTFLQGLQGKNKREAIALLQLLSERGNM